MDQSACDMLAEFFHVFSNSTRLQILCRLRDGESRTVTQLAEELGVNVQNASRNLRLMRDKGVLEASKDGQNVYYRIANQQFLDAMEAIREAIAAQWKRKAEMARS